MALRDNITRVLLVLYRLNKKLRRVPGTFGLITIAATLALLSALGLLAVRGGEDVEVNRPAAVNTKTSLPGDDNFSSVTFSISSPNTEPKQYCALLADHPKTHERGLMGRENLGSYDAMIFSFAQDSTNAFYMPYVKFPISIAWFGADGTFISAADMERCEVEPAKCQRYAAAAPYRYAIETLKGGLVGLGIGAGSTLTLGVGGCG